MRLLMLASLAAGAIVATVHLAHMFRINWLSTRLRLG
jgi:hypothetical protein